MTADLFQIAPSPVPPLVVARRELERACAHYADCVTDADKLATESCIAVIAAHVRDLEAQAVKEASK